MIISKTVRVFQLAKTSCYKLKVFNFKLNVRRQLLKTLTSVLRQIKQHEQIEIMANNGPFCKVIEMIKETSLNQNYG